MTTFRPSTISACASLVSEWGWVQAFERTERDVQRFTSSNDFMRAGLAAERLAWLHAHRPDMPGLPRRES